MLPHVVVGFFLGLGQLLGRELGALRRVVQRRLEQALPTGEVFPVEHCDEALWRPVLDLVERCRIIFGFKMRNFVGGKRRVSRAKHNDRENKNATDAKSDTFSHKNFSWK